MELKRSLLYCCCDKAHPDCESECPKGKALKPKYIVNVRKWPKRSLQYKK